MRKASLANRLSAFGRHSRANANLPKSASIGAPWLNTWFLGSNIYDSDHRTVDFVFHRAIRKDFELVMNARPVSKFPLQRAKIRHHLQHHCLEVRNFNARIDVRERAADVPRD